MGFVTNMRYASSWLLMNRWEISTLLLPWSRLLSSLASSPQRSVATTSSLDATWWIWKRSSLLFCSRRQHFLTEPLCQGKLEGTGSPCNAVSRLPWMTLASSSSSSPLRQRTRRRTTYLRRTSGCQTRSPNLQPQYNIYWTSFYNVKTDFTVWPDFRFWPGFTILQMRQE